MKIHIDTNLLIQKPQWERLPAGDHELFVSAIAFAEFSEGTVHPNPAVAARARLDLIQLRNAYGDGLPFAQHEADVYRELCANGAALATRNSSDFDGLETVLEVIAL